MLSMVDHNYDPNYLGSIEDQCFEAGPGKKLVKPYVKEQIRHGDLHM
jgi:hypothetical protein